MDAGCSLSFKAIESTDMAADPMAGGSCSETVPATLSQCSTLYTTLHRVELFYHAAVGKGLVVAA